jgi:hypothetical protein
MFLHVVVVAAAQGRHTGLCIARHRSQKAISGSPNIPICIGRSNFPNIGIKIVVHLIFALLVLIFVEVGLLTRHGSDVENPATSTELPGFAGLAKDCFLIFRTFHPHFSYISDSLLDESSRLRMCMRGGG